MSTTNIFEIAVRAKLRFATPRFASVSVEDLFDLSLRELDDVAKGINRQINAEKEESFLSENKNAVRKDLELKLEILKHIIGVKETEKAERVAQQTKSAERQKLINALAEAEQREQQSKTPEQLRAELAALDAE
ncbi:hypothetical protein POP15_057 [Pectobacterium phage POP15]|nr:hypothetical protein POP15_057 [Pectobacterium phage POP15]